jgi:hypothetical protein
VVGSSQISRSGRVGHGDGQHHPLALAAGELMRIGPGDPIRVGQAHRVQQVEHGGARGPAVRPGPVDRHHLGHLPIDPHGGVERGHRLLEDHPGPATPFGRQAALGGGHHVAVEPGDPHLTPGDQSLREQPGDGHAGQRLPRPGGADDADPLPPADGERDVVDQDGSARCDGQRADLEHGDTAVVGTVAVATGTAVAVARNSRHIF